MGKSGTGFCVKTSLSGGMAIGIKRFFASLRFAQNDNYLGSKGKRVGSGSATFNPLTLSNGITYCHSEYSEESLIFPQTVKIFTI
jgi:hypothetical protein